MSPAPRSERMVAGRELACIPWLQVLPVAEQAWVVPRLRARHCAAGDWVVQTGSPPTHWWGVTDGMLCVNHVDPERSPLMFSGIPAGGWFGEGTLLKAHPFKYGVRSLRHSTVACLAAADFHELTRRSIGFSRHVLGQLNERLSQFIAAREMERIDDDQQRLAFSLVWLRNPVLFPLAGDVLLVTQQDLAHLTGISRQRVNKALAELERAGVLRVEYRTLKILKVHELQKRAGAV